MELYDAILNRRSVRKFSEQAPSDELIEKCIEAGRWAPSWANTQCVRYVVVRDAERKRLLSECLSERNPALEAVRTAPVVVVFVAELKKSGYKKGEATDDKSWHMYDTGLASQNFCLAAHSEGLGTVIVGLMDYRKVGEILRVPEGFQVVALTPLGYPAAEGRAPQRKPIDELVFKETCG